MENTNHSMVGRPSTGEEYGSVNKVRRVMVGKRYIREKKRDPGGRSDKNSWSICIHKILVLWAVGIILWSTASASAETLKLTLDEAIALGLSNSTTLRVKLLAVGAARADIAAARSALYPSVSTSANWTHFFEQKKTQDTTLDFGTGPITIPGYYVSASDPISISADVSQSIYTFGRIKNGIKMAEEGLKTAELEMNEEKRSLIVRIKRAFYGYILAKEVVRVQEETLAQKEEALSVARQRYKAGLVPDFEVLSAESDMEGFKPDVISARNQVQFALLAVMDLLGVEDREDYDIELIGSLEPEYFNFNKEKLIQQALENNYDLQQYRAGISLADYQKSLKAKEKKPIIAGFANYTLQSGFDSQTGDNRYWGEDSWDGDLTVGVSVQMQLSSLFPWSRENAEGKKSELDLESLKVGLSSVESGIRLSIENIFLRLDEEKSKIASGHKSVELALKLYNSAKERYSNGLISSSELEDAQIGLNAAQLGFLTAVYNHKTAIFDLSDAVGVDHF